MNKSKFAGMLLLTTALLAAAAVKAESDKRSRPAMVTPKSTLRVKPEPNIAPQIPANTESRRGYRLVTDILDSFAGISESPNYAIPVNSGGQPSAVGISQNTTYMVKAGFVLASDVRHGDANSDGAVGPGDVVYLINYLFRGGPEPCPMEAGDANCDGSVGPGDVVYLINYLYRNGPPPSY